MKKEFLLVLVVIFLVNCDTSSNKQDKNSNYIQTETKGLDTLVRFTNTSKEALRFTLVAVSQKETLVTFKDFKKNSHGTVVKKLKGPDDDDYYLFKLDVPLKYELNNESKQASFLIIAAKHKKYPLGYGVKDVKVNVGGIINMDLLVDLKFDWDNAFFIGEFLASAL